LTFWQNLSQVFHPSHQTAVALYWVNLIGWVLNGVLALVRLKRLKEVHHLYIGAALACLPWWWARVLGVVLVIDDSIQHSVQVTDLDNGKTPRPDWTPVHKIGVWLLKLVGYTGP